MNASGKHETSSMTSIGVGIKEGGKPANGGDGWRRAREVVVDGSQPKNDWCRQSPAPKEDQDEKNKPTT